MRGSRIRWAVGVTTAPRPEPTLERTLQGLREAGWSRFDVFDDARRAGAWPNWISGLRALLSRHPGAEAYLMIQDDAVFCRKLRDYLEQVLWPATGVALCSPYCPSPYRSPEYGWHQQNRGWGLVGAVCWVIPPDAARAIIGDLRQIEAKSRIDARIGQWASQVGRSVWYHTPSLVQHGGVGNSALGDWNRDSLRTAADFIGQQSVPDLSSCPSPPSPLVRP